MDMVLLTALGVGGATVFGAAIGFIFKKASHRFSDIVLAFAAGVMLAAAVLGLIMPSVDYGFAMFAPAPEESASPVVAKLLALLMTIAGIFVGALCLNLVDRLVPHLHKMADVDQESHPNNRNAGKVLLFVMAIATSIDALAGGISLAMDDMSMIRAMVTIGLIGIVTFAMSAAGVKIGNVFGSRFEKKAQIAGGVILILLGTKILLEHLGILA